MVVIIGAGLGGLCCGAHLAKQGFPVTVVEQHSVPGGYASSFPRGRFNFEVSLNGTALADNAAGRMTLSANVYQKPADPEYPFHDCEVRVIQCGRIFIGKRVNSVVFLPALTSYIHVSRAPHPSNTCSRRSLENMFLTLSTTAIHGLVPSASMQSCAMFKFAVSRHPEARPKLLSI